MNIEKTPKVIQTALITGASGGIGLEIARLFANDRVNLILVARNAEKLNEIKHEFELDFQIKVSIISIDLSATGSFQEIIDYIDQKNLIVDYLVNNAGYGLQDAFLNGSADNYISMINLNINTLTSLTRTIGERMVKIGKGKILNIASIAGFQPDPYFAVYGATKAYVISFTEAIHKEFENTGVSVTVLSPGLTQTAFIERAGMENSKLLQAGAMPADLVAKAGYAGMMQAKRHVIPGTSNKIMAFFTRAIPTSGFKLNLLARMMK